MSRNGNDFSARFPSVARALSKLPDDSVVDGEIVALDETGRPSFNVLQNYNHAATPLQFYAFDLLHLAGKNLRDRPLDDRRELLRTKLMPRMPEEIHLSETLEATAAEIVAAVKKQGLEGVVAKRRDSRYEPGRRSGAWVKMRINKGQELVIGGYCKSMSGAVRPFERLRDRRRPVRADNAAKDDNGASSIANGSGELRLPGPTDLIFPKWQHELFKTILDEENLRFDREGRPRTAYSLRHTYTGVPAYRFRPERRFKVNRRTCRTRAATSARHRPRVESTKRTRRIRERSHRKRNARLSAPRTRYQPTDQTGRDAERHD